MTCRIPLGRAGLYDAIVSAEDYAYLSQWLWTFKRSRGGKLYARRHMRINNQRFTVLMHNVVLLELKQEPRPSDKHTGDHRNRNSLDNTRGNLEWATPAEQRANQVRPRRRRVETPQQEIPF